ncbi:AAA family ATPase (plasmid) [Rhizobium sp. CB3171]|uniref:AAA family ATPase n=1 Tax=Rhizobium sp. CB3171 TaxID=3039157 RepID=UPI0024B16061|nr:AAA family ATPase [Rhizobium sp. CB3171]WFU07153.1 AAA family ATPase [Rhizobium sp. CB3171]
MLSPDKVASASDDVWESSPAIQPIDLDRLIAIAWRQWRVVAVCAVVFMLLGVVYALTAEPKFTAASSLLIDKGSSGIVNQLSDSAITVDDEGTVLSQVEILKSDVIADQVVKKLDLTNNEVFMSSGNSLLGKLRSYLKVLAEKGGAADEDPETIATDTLADNLDVDRVGRTYVLNIAYTSADPVLASQISNAFSDAYLVDKLNSKYEATRRASEWLEQRIDELKQKASNADLAVQKFRAEHNLITTKDGTLVTDQQLSEQSSALIAAEQDTARAQAKYDRIEAIVKNGRTDAIVTDVLDSSVANDLRQKYLAASKTEAELSNRLGADHVQVTRLKSEMAEYQRLMFEEMSRIAESYQSELQVAKAKENTLRASLDKATDVSAAANETQVQLRELERTSDSYRGLLETSMQRFQEASQQQSFPIVEARVITEAKPPVKPSKPKKLLVVAIATFLGLALGGGIGAYREFRDRYFRTGEQIRQNLDLEYLGSTQLIKNSAAIKLTEHSDNPRAMQPLSSLYRYVIDHPHSAFAETMRSAKIAVDLHTGQKTGKIVGVVSTLPGEGKSTVAVNLAQLLAMQGAKTLLIDADLRNRGSTRAVGPHAEAGLLEVILEERQIAETLLIDPQTRLTFLPCALKRRIPHSSDLLASPAMERLLEEARARYDYVILDLPPLRPVVDARAALPLLGSLIYVVEWGATSRKIVRASVLNEPRLHSKCSGVILSKVDPTKAKFYQDFGSEEYNSRYAAYYEEA